MPDDKNITFRMGLDDTEFDNKLRAMVQKMRDAQSTLGVLGRAGQPGQVGDPRLSEVAQRNKTQLDARMDRDRRNETKKLDTEILKIEERRSDLLKIRENFEKSTIDKKKEVLKVNKDIVKAEMEQNKLLEARERLSATGGAGGGAGGGGGPFGGERYKGFRDMGFGRGTSAFLMRMAGPAAMGAAITASVAKLTSAMSSIGDELATKERNIASAQGSALAVASRQFGEQQAGKGLEGTVFAKQRSEAMRMAAEEAGTRRVRDVLRNWSWAGSAAGGIAGIAGGPAGMAAGFVAGGLGGRALYDKQARGALLGTVEYQSQMTQEQMQRAKTLEERLKDLDYYRTSAFRGMQQNLPTYRRAERAFGQARPMGRGGVLEQILGQGMAQQTGLGVGEEMMGAAGQTIREPGQFREAFELQQGGLTNAPQMMGAIRGIAAGFGEKASDDSMKRLFAEATKMGIIDSKMVQELRTFTGAALKIATKTGMGVEEAGALLAQGAVGDPSKYSLEGAMTGLEAREKESKAMGKGVLDRKLAFMGSSNVPKGIRGLSMRFKSQLGGIPLSQFSQNNKSVQRLMGETGMSFSELTEWKNMIDIAGSVPYRPTQKKLMSLARETAGMSDDEYQSYISKGGKGFELFTDIQAELEFQPGEFKGISNILGRESYVRARVRNQPGLEGAPARGGAQKAPPEVLAAGIRTGVGGEIYDKDGKVIWAPTTQDPGAELLRGVRERGAGAVTTTMEAAEAENQRAVLRRIQTHLTEFESIAKRQSAATIIVEEAMKHFGTLLGEGAVAVEAYSMSMKALADYSKTGDEEALKEQQKQVLEFVQSQSKADKRLPDTIPNTGRAGRMNRVGY